MEARTFGGKRYHALDRYTFKNHAQSDARKARGQGKRARVVKHPKPGRLGDWVVYVR